MGIIVTQVAVGGFDSNFSYVLYDSDSKEAFVIDPSGAYQKIVHNVKTHPLLVAGVLLTHTHFDHHDALHSFLALYPGSKVYVHEKGLPRIPESTDQLQDGDVLTLGTSAIEVLYTPGHIDDAVCYYVSSESAEDGIPKVITGDTLFVEGCGRTDAVGVRALYDSLQRLKALPKETEVYPGHDYGSTPCSTMQYEVAHNKYYQAKRPEDFIALRLR